MIRTRKKILKIRFVKTPIALLNNVELTIDITSLREVSIGRDPSNIVIVPDLTVSKRHAIITRVNEVLKLKDLGSKHGTYLMYNNNFIKVSEIELSSRSIVKLGNYTIIEITYYTE